MEEIEIGIIRDVVLCGESHSNRNAAKVVDNDIAGRVHSAQFEEPWT